MALLTVWKAKPAHYVVILDEIKLGADEIQAITHQ